MSEQTTDSMPDPGAGTPPASAATAKRRQRLWLVIACIVVFALLYAASVSLYAVSGGIDTTPPGGTKPPADGLTIKLTPQLVNPVGQRVSMDLSMVPGNALTAANTITPNQTINVLVTPTGGEQSITFKRNEVPAITPISIIADGEVETWPFDSYRTTHLIVAACIDSCATHPALAIKVYMQGHVPGWNFTASYKTAAHKSDRRTIDFAAFRSGSTIAFGVVLLALMIAMPCLVLFVGISTLAGNRKVEPSFMSWMAAMLFATVPLRTFLPGSPPIGSWIDFTIVLWVIVALVSGLVIYVVAWARQRS